MSEKLKRPWFRFHLLTAVLMTFAAGGLVLENPLKQKVDGMPAFYARGWPISAMYDIDPDYWSAPAEPIQFRVDAAHIVMDIAFSIVALSAVALASESLLRRREARKP